MDGRIRPGAIFHLHCHVIRPPKSKFLLLCCVDPKPVFLYINTAIPDFIARKSHLRATQVTIDQGSHGFLEYDSYVDCHAATGEFSIDDLEDALERDQSTYKCDISNAVLSHVISAVETSRTIPTLTKNWILAGLRSITET